MSSASYSPTGNRETTWTDSRTGKCWPRDLLPRDFPKARVMTFGYDADIIRMWNMAGSNRLRDHGNSLAHHLANARATCAQRLIIFIAHSLGGLVFEQSLVCCRNSNNVALQSLLTATAAVMFMGTPHSGSDLTTWGQTIVRYLSVARRANQALLSTLHPTSQVLAAVEQDFQQMLLSSQIHIKVFCFYEEIPINMVGMAAEDYSAILPQYPSQSIPANHIEMTKFSARNAAEYQAVIGQLNRWKSETAQLNDCFKQLELMERHNARKNEAFSSYKPMKSYGSRTGNRPSAFQSYESYGEMKGNSSGFEQNMRRGALVYGNVNGAQKIINGDNIHSGVGDQVFNF